VARLILEVFAAAVFFAMLQLITILNRCHHFRGFVYQQACFASNHKSIEITVRPRKGSAPVCSRCHQPAPGYDQLAERRYEFIPLWGFLVFLLYAMRRVDCRRCDAVVVEEVPWGNGKHQLTNAYMLFLARWARRLSWKETAEAFRTSWDKVCDAVEHVVMFGLEYRTLRSLFWAAVGAICLILLSKSKKNAATTKIRYLRPCEWEPFPFCCEPSCKLRTPARDASSC
jgi:hypothetical protein